jgi:hypothetical protein
MSDAMRLTHAEVDELAGLYVLDALEADEMEAVREHLATCTEPHAAFAELGGVVPALFETIEPLDAPAELRGRVLAALADVLQLPALQPTSAPVEMPAAPGVSAPSPVSAAPAVSGPTPARPTAPAAPTSISAARERRVGRGRWQTALAAAAVLLIVVLGGWNLLLQDRAGTAENRVAILRDAIAASTDPTSQVALLRGSGSAAGASGLAVFPSGRPGTIVVEGLPPAASGRRVTMGRALRPAVPRAARSSRWCGRSSSSRHRRLGSSRADPGHRGRPADHRPVERDARA